MASTNVVTQTGNRVVVEFDNKKVGLLQSARFSDNYGLEDAAGIGDINVIEHVPTKAVYGISFSKMVLIKEQMRKAGTLPENGDDALKGLVFNITVYSKDTGAALVTYSGCSYDSGDVDFSANRIVVMSGQFKALNRSGTGV